MFVSRDRPFDRRAFERSRPASIEGPGGATLPVSSAEDVVLGKLEWYRGGGEVSDRQWADIPQFRNLVHAPRADGGGDLVRAPIPRPEPDSWRLPTDLRRATECHHHAGQQDGR